MRLAPWFLPLALLMLPLAPMVGAGPVSVDNGYLMMVHGTFHPRAVHTLDEATGAPVPPAQEAEVVTVAAGTVNFNVIPYSVATGKPLRVSEAVLHVDSPLHALRVAPNADPETAPECGEETSIPGYEGPLDACLVFRVPATAFLPGEVVNLALHFRDYVDPSQCTTAPPRAQGSGDGNGHGQGDSHGQGHQERTVCPQGELRVEGYNVFQHYVIHASQNGVPPVGYPFPVTRGQADAMDLPATPFVIEDAADLG